RGHAFEARIYAEDAEKGFMPAIGTLSHLSFPAQCRVDSGVRQGDTVTPYYDPMIAKLTVHAEDRSQALNALRNALNDCHVDGCIANVGFLHRLASHAGFIAGEFDTGLIERDLDALIRVEQPDQRLTAIAAMASCGLLSQPTGDDAWETLSGWRQWSEAKQFTHLLWRDESITCQVVSHHSGEMVVSFDDNTLHVEVIDASADQYRLRCGDELLTMRVLQSERTVTLFREGQTHRFFLPDQLSDLDNAGVAENTILSPMPGKIVSVSVNPGDTLSEGDAVMVMEAMKMEHTLCAPRDGVVAEIPVTEGDQISEGTLMLRMETET
ncbi:MAG TPA: 3-methylcrotonyl-CoA carboxylase, partial [Gammaproteobacteria bacterium]|nr:3-methylcrotonyl-CoA carboxylase [Gammaproteobacteria bacterium]